jgi:polysaccharide deacetylase family protein (PEP-CTERM system associated)
MVHTSVLEVPIATARVLRTNLPAGGGGYFRLLPYPVSRWLLRRVNLRDEESAIFYFHPWEIDPEQPRVDGVDAKTRWRHYINLERTADRLRLLLRDFRWDRMDRVVFGVA